MAKTRTELVYRALKNLGVLPSGQGTPSAEESNAVDDLIDPMIENLIARDIVFIEDVEAIRDEHFLPLGHLLASQAAAEFGMQADIQIAARGQKAEEELQEMDTISQRYTHYTRTMRTDYPITVYGSSDLSTTTT